MEKFVEQYFNKKGLTIEKMFIYDGEVVLFIPKRVAMVHRILFNNDMRKYFNLISHIRTTKTYYDITIENIIEQRVRIGKLTKEEYKKIMETWKHS